MARLLPMRPLADWPEGAAAVRALGLDVSDLLERGTGLEYRPDGSVWLSYYLNSDRDPRTGDAIEHRDLVPDVRWNG